MAMEHHRGGSELPSLYLSSLSPNGLRQQWSLLQAAFDVETNDKLSAATTSAAVRASLSRHRRQAPLPVLLSTTAAQRRQGSSFSSFVVSFKPSNNGRTHLPCFQRAECAVADGVRAGVSRRWSLSPLMARHAVPLSSSSRQCCTMAAAEFDNVVSVDVNQRSGATGALPWSSGSKLACEVGGGVTRRHRPTVLPLPPSPSVKQQ